MPEKLMFLTFSQYFFCGKSIYCYSIKQEQSSIIANSCNCLLAASIWKHTRIILCRVEVQLKILFLVAQALLATTDDSIKRWEFFLVRRKTGRPSIFFKGNKSSLHLHVNNKNVLWHKMLLSVYITKDQLFTA